MYDCSTSKTGLKSILNWYFIKSVAVLYPKSKLIFTPSTGFRGSLGLTGEVTKATNKVAEKTLLVEYSSLHFRRSETYFNIYRKQKEVNYFVEHRGCIPSRLNCRIPRNGSCSAYWPPKMATRTVRSNASTESESRKNNFLTLNYSAIRNNKKRQKYCIECACGV